MDDFGGMLQGHMWYVVLVMLPQLNVSPTDLSPEIAIQHMHQIDKKFSICWLIRNVEYEN